MLYTAQVLKIIDKDILEGQILISVDNLILPVYYQAPEEFITSYLEQLPCQKVVDLWLVYGQGKKLDKTADKDMFFTSDINVCGGKFKGIVIEVKADNQYTLDCGFLIDIQDEGDIIFKVGDFITTSGTYQIYFHETKWSK